jgi:4-hydroxybenzoate polyprenyltransferase
MHALAAAARWFALSLVIGLPVSWISNAVGIPAIFWVFVAIALFMFARDIQKAQVLDRLIERMRRDEL